jgi:phospholipase D1/2
MSSDDGNCGILHPPANCWRTAHADRVAWLIDGAAYFAAFREAVKRARHSVLILGWDFDSRIELVKAPPDDGLPITLGAFLNAVTKRTHGLQMHIIEWDFAMLFAGNREWLPMYQLGWRTHRRLHFRLDDQHPLGASHHEKIVVVDDRIAFCGGLDLTRGRWDTPAHQPNDPRRITPTGQAAQPYHDVQMVVTGDAAAALGALARERWLHLTGERLDPPPDRARTDWNVWPPGLEVELDDTDLSILRTRPEYRGAEAVREVERGYLDAIAAARRTIYIENQYFTARRVGAALLARLREADGPEIVVVLPFKTDGWLSESTMGVLREQLLDELQAADEHGRLRVYYPWIAALGDVCINQHAKLLIIDDELARVGSANLNNRSMGLDTECDLALEARGSDRVRAAIARLRDRLLAEHLDTEPATVAAVHARTGSLITTIEQLGTEGRSLRPLPSGIAPSIDPMLTDPRLIDPERPGDQDELIAELVPQEKHGRNRFMLWIPVGILLGALLLAAAWRWTALGDWLDLETMMALGRRLRQAELAPALAFGIFVVSSMLAVPVTLLILVAVLVFGPLAGFSYALTGSLASAAFTYYLGRWSGRDLVRRLAGERIEQLDHRLRHSSVMAVVALRVLPIAPFIVFNLVAGALRVPFRNFLLGTLFGMGPGILAIALFADRVVASIRDPSAVSLLALIGVAIAIGAVGYLSYRWLSRRARAGRQARNPA